MLRICIYNNLYTTINATECMLSTLYAIAQCPSVRLSVTWVDQSKTVEVRIMYAPSLEFLQSKVSSRNFDKSSVKFKCYGAEGPKITILRRLDFCCTNVKVCGLSTVYNVTVMLVWST